MYPDKVGRVIIDGVLDGNEYRSAKWDSNLADNEAVIDSLFTFCHQAGPTKCPLYESTPSAIRDRFYRVLASVEENSVAIPLAEPPLVPDREGDIGPRQRVTPHGFDTVGEFGAVGLQEQIGRAHV